MSVPHRDDEPDETDATGDAGAVQGAGPGAPAGAEPEAGPTDPHEAAWLAIVQNYGERPAWEEPAPRADPPTHPEHPAGRGREDRRRDRHPREDEAAYAGPDPVWPDDSDLERGPEERYVPPPPPPLPRTSLVRFLAWFGLLGVPSVVLLTVVLGARLPTWSDTILLVWFVGGFAYLVASMRRGQGHPDDDPDHGAVL